jgi:hypothetical protein
MKRLLCTLAVIFAASVAFAAEPSDRPHLRAIADGAAVRLVSDLPQATQQVWTIIPGETGKPAHFLLAAVIDGKIKVWDFSVQFDPAPTPQPTPNPTPDPTPPPVPPTPTPEKIWGVVFLSETGTRTPAQGKAIASKAVADYAASKGWHSPKVIDPNVVDEKNASLPTVEAYKARAKGEHYFFVVSDPKPGEPCVIVAEGAIVDEKAMLETLKKAGG